MDTLRTTATGELSAAMAAAVVACTPMVAGDESASAATVQEAEGEPP